MARKDEEIADVLTFVRNHFGNKADPVTPAEGGRSETRQSLRGERVRPTEGAAGGPAMAADGGLAGVAGGEAGDELGGECEPAVEAS